LHSLKHSAFGDWADTRHADAGQDKSNPTDVNRINARPGANPAVRELSSPSSDGAATVAQNGPNRTTMDDDRRRLRCAAGDGLARPGWLLRSRWEPSDLRRTQRIATGT
jgi:hypothetical protein